MIKATKDNHFERQFPYVSFYGKGAQLTLLNHDEKVIGHTCKDRIEVGKCDTL